MRVKKLLVMLVSAAALAAGTGTAAMAIVGGSPAQQAPSWIGSLQLSGGRHECGASLVSSLGRHGQSLHPDESGAGAFRLPGQLQRR